MDRGRFTSWPLLLYTRDTPPVLAGPGTIFPRRIGWSLLLLAVLLIAGVTVRLGQRNPTMQLLLVVSPTSAPVSPAPRIQRW